jgi:hypothetical protein
LAKACYAAAFCALEPYLPDLASAGERDHIDLNIPEFRLRYSGMEFPVSIGKPNAKKHTETPTGEGVIYEKIISPMFYYKDPPNTGKLITHVQSPDGRTIKVPYRDMRSLGIRMDAGKRWGLTEKFRIHSTAQSWDIGKAVSDGCIRMNVEDMLELYPQVPENAKTILRYDTVRIDEGGFTILPDIYRKGTNTPQMLESCFRKAGASIPEQEKLHNILKGHLGKYVRFSEI